MLSRSHTANYGLPVYIIECLCSVSRKDYTGWLTHKRIACQKDFETDPGWMEFPCSQFCIVIPGVFCTVFALVDWETRMQTMPYCTWCTKVNLLMFLSIIEEICHCSRKDSAYSKWNVFRCLTHKICAAFCQGFLWQFSVTNEHWISVIEAEGNFNLNVVFGARVWTVLK